MKEQVSKKGIKQIICIIVVIMLCNFIIPNYSHAVSTEGGGSLAKTIAQFLCFIPDAVINFLQNMFVSPQGIKVAGGTYEVLYSPGTIFAGTVPAFDINFIEPMPAKEVTATYTGINMADASSMTEDIRNVFGRLKRNKIANKNNQYYYNINNTSKVSEKYGYDSRTVDIYLLNFDFDDWFKDPLKVASYIDNEEIIWIGSGYSNAFLWICDNTAYLMVEHTAFILVGYLYSYAIFETTLTDSELQSFIERDAGTSTKTYKSIASILQDIVATWYNALRRIALVGLLSVLVYLGIRIVLSSTSAKEKAKYKSMLKDWLVALCLLFTLHYVMNITITVVDKVNEVIGASAIRPNGEDILMSTVRNYIATGDKDDWGSVLAYVVIYCVLAVYTVIFTIQYLRRVIYIAFLTVIAPLITLTYPLDKLKDEKSQAFDMWLKDYIFFSLIQVLHLLVYYIFLESSLDLANQGNWIFAIVAIGFMTKAEKIMKKMFGFEKSKTLGALGAGATGALVMNAINKIPHKSPKGGKSGGESGTGGGSSSNVRTATNNPLATLSTGGAMPVNSSGGSYGSSSQGSGGSSGTGMGGINTTQNANRNSSINGTRFRNRRTSGNSSKNTTSSSNTNKPKRNLGGGAASLIGRYARPVTGKTLGILTGGAGAMIGFASGVAQGDVSAALKGAAAGGVAGMSLGKGAVNLPSNIANGVKNGWNNIKDTYREGAYGEEYANNVKFDREFRNSSAYKELRRNSEFSDRDFDDKVKQILDSGITDTKRMGKILKNHKKHPRKYNMDKAIAYSEMAETCKDTILYDNKKFIRFCQDHKIEISEEELENLRKCIMDFK